MTGIPVTFTARGDPLEPLGVAGIGKVAIALARCALARDDGVHTSWRGVASGDAVLIFGESESLPWVDGAQYLGRDPAAPHLWMPTAHRPNVPADALERALLRHAGALAPPLAIVLDPHRIISVAKASPIVRARLQAWLEERA